MSLLSSLYDELAGNVRGPVLRPHDAEFSQRSKTFNGKIVPRSKLVVSPLDAEDVSAIVKFCNKHSLSLSVRAGGYGIAGWAVAGEVVIDMSLIKDIDIEPPAPEEEGRCRWTRLKDMPAPGSKGKGRIGEPKHVPATTSAPPVVQLEPSTVIKTSVKRRREEDGEEVEEEHQQPVAIDPSIIWADRPFPNYDNASQNVAAFLRGPPLPPEEGETPRQPPTNRRRLHSPDREDGPPQSRSQAPAIDTRQISSESSSSETISTSGSGAISRSLSASTAMTSPVDAPPDSGASFLPVSGTSPFGYMGSGPSSSQPRPSILGGSDPFGYMASAHTLANSIGAGFASSNFSIPLTINPLPGRSFAIPPTQPNLSAPPRSIHPHAYVTFGAGVMQKEIDLYTADHPLEGVSAVTGEREEGIVPYHVPSSAHPVGSAAMLLSGFGFLSRLYGLSGDNLVEVEMVLADGRIVIVSEGDDPELWWAIRGAGPAFGIVTRYKAKAYPVPVVFAGNLIYRFHRSTAPSLIKHFRDCIKGVPRELYANVLLTAGPAHQDSLIVIQICYLGSKEEGQEYLNAISSWDGERCLLNEVNEKSFLMQQDSVAQILRGKPGRQWFLRSSLAHSLPDEVIHQTVMRFADTPIGCTWIFELSGGAIADFEDTCLPKEQREAKWTIAALHQWDMGIDDPRCITTAEDWMSDTIRTVSVGGPYPVFLGRHETAARTQASFGKNWSRLVELKKKYDPANFFCNNFWPLDKDGNPVQPLDNEPPSPVMENIPLGRRLS